MVFHYNCGCKIEVVQHKLGRAFFCKKHRPDPSKPETLNIRQRAEAYYTKKYAEIMEQYKRFGPS